MKTAHALLVTSAVATAGLWLAERQHRQRLALNAADIHQRLLADTDANPQYRAIWAVPELPDEEKAHLLHCNRQVSFLSAKFRVGLLDGPGLRVQARALMEHAPYRAYWARYGAFREDEALDRTDHKFNSIFDDEYTAAADAAKEPVVV